MLEVIHSPRLEDLADQLAEQLRAQRRRHVENILQPITVVVGHLGIARWLEQRIATRFGIFANVRFVLTGEWLNAEMARFGLLEKVDAARFSLGAMTWALYALLAAPERFGLASDTPLLERERFQLAARLARLFSEYLIYRREWLLDFEQQAARAPLRHTRLQAPVESKIWQARLWAAMSARLQGGHRAAKFQSLLNAINGQAVSDVPIDTPIYFFGLNHLPPDVLTLLERFSEQVSVQIYFPNPCVEYWADVVRERFLLQRRLGGDLLNAAGADDPGGFDHFDVGHPLLASLGGHGQAYFAELSHATEHFIEVIPTQAQAATPTLLVALQHGISHLQPDFAPATLCFERSIQVFSAQNIVDELTQLKAILFDALLSDPNLRLEEIAIMTPNLRRYAPLLPAVFGAELCASPSIAQQDQSVVQPGPRPQSALRYSVLDLTQLSASPLLSQLLQAPELRWEPNQLLALLTLAEVALHFSLDANDLSHAPRLLQRAHIAFGFNDVHRRQLISATAGATVAEDASSTFLPSASFHTWEAGLERLLFGYLHGNQSELYGADAPERLWPVPDIEARHAPILSAILQLIRALRVFNFGAQRDRTVGEWTRWFERQMFAFTGAPAPDAVRAVFAQLELDALDAELDNEVSFVALREACNALAAQSSRRSTPALGAICVCGLVPMRALPFKVVCILGLNEAEFPKPETPDSLNLMRAVGARRPGDRSRAQEDRYLFLEAIMAARSRLVLSYQGVNSDGSKRLPCGVLTELLAQLERQFKARLSGTPWFNAVQASTHNLPSTVYSSTIAGATLPGKTISAKSTKAAAQTLNITELFRFWRQPLRAYVQQRLLLAPRQSSEGQTDDAQSLEPLALATLPIERIEARLLSHALAAGDFPETAPPWLGRSGLLPSGALGLQSYAGIEDASRAAWFSINEKFPKFIGAAKQPFRVDLNLAGTRLVGSLAGVYLDQRACVCVSSKALHGAQRWQLLLQVLLLRATVSDSDAPPWRALHLGPKADELVIHSSPSEARDFLANLIKLRRDHLQPNQPADLLRNYAAPPWFWPKLSYTAFSAKDGAHAAVLKVIEDGRDYELAQSGLNFWLPNAAFFDADSTEFAQFLALAQTLFAPFEPPTQAANPRTDKLSSDLTSGPPPRAFVVTKMPVPEASSPPSNTELLPRENVPSPLATQASNHTLNLEQFGHDDEADYRDDY